MGGAGMVDHLVLSKATAISWCDMGGDVDATAVIPIYNNM